MMTGRYNATSTIGSNFYHFILNDGSRRIRSARLLPRPDRRKFSLAPTKGNHPLSSSSSRFIYIGAVAAAVAATSAAVTLERYGEHDSRQLTPEEVNAASDDLDRLTVTRWEDDGDGPRTTQAEIIGQHLHNLDRYGVTVVPKFLSAEEAEEWRGRFREGIRIKEWRRQNSTGDRHPGAGRVHCVLTKDSKFRDDLAALGTDGGSSGSVLMNLARRYFGHEHASDGGPRPTAIPFHITQLQFLEARPPSTNQIWHRDNVSPGLTVLVALTDVTDNGPTELLPGTHRRRRGAEGGRPLLAVLAEGDAVVYDSRVIHRGRGYRSHRVDDGGGDGSAAPEPTLLYRPALVLRWDADQTPPPGSRLFGTSMIASLGSFYAICDWVMT
mmetsp:Transcript_8675/g.13149  ORF Transcript_8675/g.13149 Transcript_8675/m.13149 type:complete len:383 (-) Transcript_8675:87-1235(-)